MLKVNDWIRVKEDPLVSTKPNYIGKIVRIFDDSELPIYEIHFYGTDKENIYANFREVEYDFDVIKIPEEEAMLYKLSN